MRCKHCGKENRDYAKFCETCGKPLQESASANPPANAGASVIQAHKKQVIAGAIILLIAVACITCFLVYSNSQKTAEYKGKLESSDKYLAAMDYDNAEKVLQEAINIQPNKDDAYVKLAGLYTDQGRYKDAVEILQKGQKKAGGKNIDSRLKKAKKIKKAGAGTEQAQAYLDLWEEYQDKYGSGSVRYIGEDGAGGFVYGLQGLCLAKAFDFNDDGNKELILAYPNDEYDGIYNYEIWAWEDGKAVNILPEMLASHGQDIDSWIETAVKDGTTYLCKNYSGEDVDCMKYVGGEFQTEYSYEILWSDDGYDGSMVNGKKFSKEYPEEELKDFPGEAGPDFNENMQYTVADSGATIIRLSGLTKSYAEAVLDDTAKTIESLQEVAAMEDEEMEETQTQTSGAEQYQAYYDLCMDYQDEYGEGKRGKGSLKGLCVAKLCDFNDDGNEELLLVYGAEEYALEVEIWSWQNGKPVKAIHRDGPSYFPDGTQWVETVVRDGTLCLYDGFLADMGSMAEYLEYKDGTFKSKCKYEEIWNSEEEKLEYLINGDKVSKSEAEKEGLPESKALESTADYTADRDEAFIIYLSKMWDTYEKAVLDDTAATIEKLKQGGQ